MRRASILIVVSILLLPLAGIADAWQQINQPVGKPDAWQQIVLQTRFSLGQAAVKTTPNGVDFMQIGYGTYPSLDGSTVAVPMAVEFARQHLMMAEADLAGFVSFSTTHHAYENLINRRPNGAPMLAAQNAVMDGTHPVDLIIATEPSKEELALAEAKGVALVAKPVCYDAFVFITHVDNPVDSLTIEEIRGIYAGRITDWSEVGGLPMEIRAYQREQNSGSQTAMENLVMQGEAILSKGRSFYYVSDMSSLVDRVGGYENDPNSLGYTYRYYIDVLYRDEAIKVLAVDGVYPSDAHVQTGVYPLATHYYGVLRAGEEGASGGRFLDWMLSGEGQRCIAQAGYIPIPPEEAP